MKRVNEAFHNRDIDELELVSAETAFEDASFEEKSIGEKLVWGIREVSPLDDLIASIIEERRSFMESDLAQLWQRQEAGEQVIEHLEQDARRDIERARQRLEQVVSRFHRMKAEVRHG